MIVTNTATKYSYKAKISKIGKIYYIHPEKDIIIISVLPVWIA